MISSRNWSAFLIVIVALVSQSWAHADVFSEEQHRSVVVRKIGHELLLMTGDSTSVVLPVTASEDRYLLRFSSEFSFLPEQLSGKIDSVMQLVHMKNSYIVEVLSCEDQSVLYTYQHSGFNFDSLDVATCSGRPYPESCYQIAITFGDSQVTLEGNSMKATETSESFFLSIYWLLAVVSVAAIGVIVFLVIRSKNQSPKDHIIVIGAYTFDKRNMYLSFKGEKVELTSKEADLLFLLHSSANETLERDVILRIVWGDEGDYVGRTLDVFISKLRKKLAGDPSIKIANIRGVGYRLVVDSSDI